MISPHGGNRERKTRGHSHRRLPVQCQIGRKVRPALVVQADTWNERLDNTILASITSSRNQRIGDPTLYFIDIAAANGQQTGLRLNSVVQCKNLITYDQSRIGRVIGSLSNAAMDEINACLRAALGIP